MIVMKAIGTTLMSTPLAAAQLRGTPHAPTLKARGFLSG